MPGKVAIVTFHADAENDARRYLAYIEGEIAPYSDWEVEPKLQWTKTRQVKKVGQAEDVECLYVFRLGEIHEQFLMTDQRGALY